MKRWFFKTLLFNQVILFVVIICTSFLSMLRTCYLVYNCHYISVRLKSQASYLYLSKNNPSQIIPIIFVIIVKIEILLLPQFIYCIYFPHEYIISTTYLVSQLFISLCWNSFMYLNACVFTCQESYIIKAAKLSQIADVLFSTVSTSISTKTNICLNTFICRFLARWISQIA